MGSQVVKISKVFLADIFKTDSIRVDVQNPLPQDAVLVEVREDDPDTLLLYFESSTWPATDVPYVYTVVFTKPKDAGGIE